MATTAVDLELYELLLKLAQVSAKLNDERADLEPLLLERTNLAERLRQRGFMITEQQQESLSARLRQ